MIELSLRRQWAHVLALAFFCTLMLSGCAAPNVQAYANEKPTLDLREYFNGKLKAHGLFTDRSGNVVKRFDVDLTGTWQGDEGVLDEQFHYSDGSTSSRVWHLKYLGQGRYEGRAEDVVGTAQGQSAGNALHWTYTLQLPVDGTIYHVHLDDWMVLMNDNVMINNTAMQKFGLEWGRVSLVFIKP